MMNLPSVVIQDSSELDSAEASQPRQQWSSRFTFLFASAACAIGLGNLWRFPGLAVEYGGAPFLIPYVLAILLIGFPLMLFEISAGQIYQGGTVDALGSLDKRFRGLGFSCGFASFGISVYYTSILAIGLQYTVIVLFSGIPFELSSENVDICKTFIDSESCAVAVEGQCEWFEAIGECIINYTKPASDYYYDLTGFTAEDNIAINVGMAFSLLAVWVIVFLALFKGTVSMGWIVYFSFSIPIIILIILAIRGLTLEGSGAGVASFIGNFSWHHLANPRVYVDACAQIFMSLNLTYGVLPTYASYNSRKQNVYQDTIIIVIANSIVSLIAGFAVFTAAGYVAHESESFDSNGDLIYRGAFFNGPNLIFLLYPVALTWLPASQVFGFLFFLAFFLLGIDSAFAMSEALTTTFLDCRFYRKHFYKKYGRIGITAPFLCFCFFVSLIYGTGMGERFLDVSDHYINSLLGPTMGYLEALLVGWVYKADGAAQRVGKLASGVLKTTFFTGKIFLAFFLFIVPNLGPNVSLPRGYEAVPIGLGLAIIFFGMIASYYLTLNEDGVTGEPLSVKDKLSLLFLGGCETYRREVNEITASRKNQWQVPLVFVVAIKYIVPVILTFMLALHFAPGTVGTFGRYGGYNPWMHMYALGIFVLPGLFVTFVCMNYPDAFDFLVPEESAVQEKVAMSLRNAGYQTSTAPPQRRSSKSAI